MKSREDDVNILLSIFSFIFFASVNLPNCCYEIVTIALYDGVGMANGQFRYDQKPLDL